MTVVTSDPLAGHTLAKPTPVLFVIMDRMHARFYVDDAEGLRELPGDDADWTRGGRFHEGRSHSPGVGERRYHNIREEQHRRHYHAVAGHLAASLKDRHAIGVILGGEHRTLMEFRTTLPGELDRQVLHTMAMSPNAIRRQRMRPEAEAARHFMR